MSLFRSRWAAVGAAVAVTLGAGGIGLVSATTPATAVTFVPITACRVMDTRPAPDNVGPRSAPLGTADTHTVDAHGANGDCTGIPTTATALSLNVTAIGATQPTFLTIWATDQARPEASSLNPVPGSPPTPNAVATELSGDGEFNIYNLQGDVDVIADINGYYVDHHHDDRYYTKAEIDGRAAGDVVAMGIVTTSAAILELRVRSGVTVSANVPATGAVTMRVDGADTDDVPIVLITPHHPAAGARTCNSRLLSTQTDTVYDVRFECYDDSGASAQTAFQFVIVD